jgi:hypothetical protein
MYNMFSIILNFLEIYYLCLKHTVMNKKSNSNDFRRLGKSPEGFRIDNANVPFINSLYRNFPSAQLRTDGLNVGLL